MNKQTFLAIVKDPTKIGAQDIAGLEELVSNFPFCQTAHLLIAKGARDYGSMHAEQKLKKAAAYSLNRRKLKEFIQRTADTLQSKVTVSQVKPDVLPTVDQIIVEQKTEAKQEKRRYEEIEENLKLIEFFRTEAKKPGPEPEALIEKEPVSEPKTEERKQEVDLFEEQEPVIVETQLTKPDESMPAIQLEETEPQHFIYSSRLEDVFLQELEIDSVHHKSDADILLDYLDYIHENKLGKMRDKKKQQEIIEKFIHADPVIPTLKPDALPQNQEDLASESSRISKNPVSETFAKILLLQGRKDKAIEIYEQLMLKFPEKKSYFAAEIDKLKK
ncbi:MAG: hypothetical protein ACJ75J_04570 [Cytophagaceae bacterium]